MKEEKSKLTLKPINDLLSEDFFIPAYQRGYRWSERQVEELLNDIWTFRKDSEDGPKKAFYCLQPVVVSKNESSWEVVDGQQRLTTIYLIMEVLKDGLTFLGKEKYSIKYETRPDSYDFLQNIDLSRQNKNIDYNHICRAYTTIEDWFATKGGTTKINFLTTLLNDEESGKNVKVIWYDITSENADGNYGIDVFTRINISKIPLTNAELIKALFLGNLKPENPNQKASYKQLQIATEWDRIENTLQDDAFWYFIYDKDNKNLPKKKYETRIEYIFDLMKEVKGDEEKYFTFYRFLEDDFKKNKIKEGIPDIEAIWRDIKEYFLTFEEWYQNRELYHKVGFLIATGIDIRIIIDNAKVLTKSDFKKYLDKKIKEKVQFDLDELDYLNNADKEKIRRVLLLFNILTLLSNNKSNSLFPFDSYKKGEWDIEHIRSQSEVELTGKDRVEWAKLVLEYYSGEKVTDENLMKQKSLIEDLKEESKEEEEKEKRIGFALIEFISSENTDEGFDELYENVSNAFKEVNPPNSDDISNLCLLDAGTNRAYKNAFFPIKRMIIMKREMTGSFIPICTKNVFLKAYSRRFKKVMYWDNTDAEDYLQAIKKTIKPYSNREGENHG